MVRKPGADIVFRGGYVVDGSGKPGFEGDVAVADGRIAEVAQAVRVVGAREIDARGKVVCPGFIDVHGHAELALFVRPDLPEYISQGVTTVINGNCGHSITPGDPRFIWEYMFSSGQVPLEQPALPYWSGFESYRNCVRESGGTSANVGCLLGHGTLRWYVMGRSQDRVPTAAELGKMQSIVGRAMEEGALGISTGLPYIPNCYATTEEVIAIAGVVGKMGGVYASHVRSERGMEDGVREAIRVGEESGARVQVSHLAMTEAAAYGLVSEARVRGIAVTVDTIPRKSGIIVSKRRLTQFVLTFFPEYFGTSLERVLTDLRTEPGQARFLASRDPIFSIDKARVSLVRTTPDLEGKSVLAIARERGTSPDECLLELLLDPSVEAHFWLAKPADPTVGAIPPEPTMASRFAGVGSDILMLIHEEDPEWYDILRQGAFPIFLQQARKTGVALEEAVRRVTSLPATTFGLSQRGALTSGYAADIIAFDPDLFDLPKQFALDPTEPTQRVQGLSAAVVNGVSVWEDGRPCLGSRPGSFLLSSASGRCIGASR